VALDDVVISAKNRPALDESNRKPFKEPGQVGAGVDLHVRREFVAQLAGQPVDQRRVAEMVFPLPIVTMGLERVPAVGAEQHDPPSLF